MQGNITCLNKVVFLLFFLKLFRRLLKTLASDVKVIFITSLYVCVFLFFFLKKIDHNYVEDTRNVLRYDVFISFFIEILL